jgi:hypothetical protein
VNQNKQSEKEHSFISYPYLNALMVQKTLLSKAKKNLRDLCEPKKQPQSNLRDLRETTRIKISKAKKNLRDQREPK